MPWDGTGYTMNRFRSPSHNSKRDSALKPAETIDENKSLLRIDLPAHLLSMGMSLPEPTAAAAARATKVWDVRVGPYKKHVVGGRLVPTVPSINVFSSKKRKFFVEVTRTRKGPNVGSVLNLTIPDELDATALEGSQLADGDSVFIRDFKRIRAAKPSGSGDDDESVASSVVATLTNAFSPGSPSRRAPKEWRLYQNFRLQDVTILKTHGRTIEAKIGAGNETVVRDVKFESDKDAELFAFFVDKLSELDKERAKHQIAKFKQQKSEASSQDRSTVSPTAVDSLERILLLVEIVSATDIPAADLSLGHATSLGQATSDSYVICRMGGKEVHRTNVIPKTLDPIWTLDKGSLFLLSMTAEEFFASSGGMTCVVKDYDALGRNEVLGHVYVPLDDLLKAKGDRMGYEIIPEKVKKKKDPKAKKGRLFVRVRPASESDVQFLNEYQSSRKASRIGVYCEETFLPIRPPNSKFLKRQGKRSSETKEYLYRVKPFPDPSREEETTWMTKDQIIEEAQKPSTHWVESGSGNIGKLYLELLGCDNLPNMDMLTLNIRDKTDAFVCAVFEDCIVNSDVIGDSLSPKWMPWCRRAFVFNIAHPSSSLLLGVFDYDPELSPLQLASRVTSDLHDPIGRVLIHLSNFMPSTVHTVAFPLFFGETPDQRKNQRGTLWIRMRIEWVSPRKAILAAAWPPPASIVSVARRVDFQIAQYTAEGPYDDRDFDMNVFAKYVEELESYEIVLLYIKEALYTVIFWRGHCALEIFGRQFMVPFHSLTAFVWGNIIAWDFNRVISFLIFLIGWIFLAVNEYQRRTPSPWHRCPPYFPGFYALLYDRVPFERRVKPNQDQDAVHAYMDAVKGRHERWKRDKQIEAEHDVEMHKEFGEEIEQAGAGDVDITSEKGGLLKKLTFNPLKPVLYPIQLQLREVVILLRIAKSIVLWEESYFAFWITTLCFVGSLVTFWLPFGFVFRWIFRVGAFVGLGPWMAFVDHWYFRENRGLTDEEKDAEIGKRLRARYEEVVMAASNYQVRKERAVKMKSMKTYMFGRFHVRVPRFSEDIFKDTPLPESYAEPYNTNKWPPVVVSERRYGQVLSGDMIPKREVQVKEHRDSDKADLFSVLEDTGGMVVSMAAKPVERIPLLGRAFGRRRRDGYSSVVTQGDEGKREVDAVK